MTDIQKALTLQSEGKFEEAKDIYLEFLKNSPLQPDVSNLLGLVYLQQNLLDEAKKQFEIAIKGFPCAEFYQNLGLVYFKNREYKTSMEHFSKAIEYESSNVEFIRNFAQMAKKTEQTDFAVTFF